jgi:hypothetical protein
MVNKNLILSCAVMNLALVAVLLPTRAQSQVAGSKDVQRENSSVVSAPRDQSSTAISVGQIENENPNLRYPSNVRLILTGGSHAVAKGMSGESGAKQPGAADLTTGMAFSALLGFGHGMFTFETGISSLAQPFAFDLEIAPGKTQRFGVNTQSLAIPVLVKFNYFEKYLSTFFLKAGAERLIIQGASEFQFTPVGLTSTVSNSVARESWVGVFGLGGTAELTQSVAILLDLTYHRGFAPIDTNGTRAEAYTASAGLSINL